ncbi:FAD-dependent oxidoreductase [Acrocarpospora macrocephala]|uniref:FAD-dependent oxidoreductase n=1 Tax=Acrocarpospora macrocephala TaxID=150177 RepID=UPI0014787C8C|nr:FAD-dependent oxidoreductase [Acrocarpospora macrocephala]
MERVEQDVVVLGSGAAGLAAALSASSSGARVTVLERTAFIGGTSATSTGLVYAPGSAKMKEKGVTEDLDAALDYLRAVAPQGLDEARAREFLQRAAEVIDFLESHAVPFRPTGLKDYNAGIPGASQSRAVAPESCDPATLGDRAGEIRRSPYRALDNGAEWSGGTALIGHLLRACLRAGVTVLTKARGTELVVESGEVTGVVADGVTLTAPGGVILATGGFEYNRDLLDRYLPKVEAAWSSPENTGDGLRLAEAAGAKLAWTGAAQWYALLRLHDEDREGTPKYEDASSARCLPGSIIVDRHGRRFANEGANFHDFGRALAQADLPAWLVIDQRFLDIYGPRCFGDRPPAKDRWFTAATPAELGELIGVDLADTIARFNVDAAELHDSQFGRGSTEFDQSWGDGDNQGPAACLAPLTRPPLQATRVYAGLSGTNGGPLTDTSGRVLDGAERPIPGLFAVGNAAATFLGDGAPGSGSTLGPGLVYGYLAGRAAATRTRA